jgi:uncharacterized protein (TIGR03435 family)
LYALVVAKGGPKIKPINESDWTPDDHRGGEEWLEQVRRGEMGFCGFLYGHETGPTTMGLAFGGPTMTSFARTLSSITHRPVVDQTGLPGRFRFYLEYAPEDMKCAFRRCRARREV